MWYQIGRKMRPRARARPLAPFTFTWRSQPLRTSLVLKVGWERTMPLRSFSPHKQFHIWFQLHLVNFTRSCLNWMASYFSSSCLPCRSPVDHAYDIYSSMSTSYFNCYATISRNKLLTKLQHVQWPKMVFLPFFYKKLINT